MSTRTTFEPSAPAAGRRLPVAPAQALLTVAIVVAGVLATDLVAHGSLYTQGLVLTAAVFGILALSLDLVAGMLGLYSLGQAGLFALGAYATTLMQADHGTSVFVMLPVCIVGTGLVGIGLGALSLRVSGLYFAITTFVFTLVLTVIASDFSFTGGLQGLLGPEFPAFPSGLQGLGVPVAWAIGLSLGAAVLVMVCLRRSPLYPVLLAIRDAEPMAAAAGARTSLIKVAMFGLSAALAGLAGWAFSFLGVVSPGQFEWSTSVDILVMVILGGMNTTLGPLIGAAFVSMFPSAVNISPDWQQILFGSLFVLGIVFAPGGVMGLLRQALARLRPAVPGLATRPPRRGAEAVAATEGVVPALPGGDSRAAPAPRDDAAPVVRVRDLVFAYGPGAPAIDHVQLTVRRGSIHGLIGPNGSGKSTLLNLIAGRLRAAEGTIEIDGQLVERAGPARRARLGFTRTFQDATLVKELSSAQNVGIGLYADYPGLALRGPLWPLLPASRKTARAIAGRAVQALDDVGAQGWARARVADVPHGVAQLTQLAAACVSGPRTVVLDEPLAGLSPTEVEHVGELLGELRDRGVSVVLIEHQPRFVFSVCDEVTVLNAGRVVASGPSVQVRADDEVRRVYLGQ